MARIGLAFKVFFKILGDRFFADRVASLSEDDSAVVPASKPAPTVAKREPLLGRSDALNLLAVLQREARFVDFVKESIAGYSDAQVGAAVRDVHRTCGDVLERLFALHPLRTEAEGADITIPADFDAARVRLVGNVAGQPPFHGRLTHAGWEATKTQLPEWTGPEASARVVAPAEVEISQ